MAAGPGGGAVAASGLGGFAAQAKRAKPRIATGDADGLGHPFDVVILGVGPDGHLASLFPGRREIEVDGLGALPVRNSPKLPPERVSLTREQLCAATEVWFVAAGQDKSGAIRDAIRPGEVPLPVARVRGERATIWLLDTAAASSL